MSFSTNEQRIDAVLKQLDVMQLQVDKLKALCKEFRVSVKNDDILCIPGTIQVAAPQLVFKEAPSWRRLIISKDGIIKPNARTDFFWPAPRTMRMVKALNPDTKRQSFDKNIRFIAEKLSITPEEVIKTNPVLIGRRLGLSNMSLHIMIGRMYGRLASGANY